MKTKIPAPVLLLSAILLASGGVFLLLQYKPWMQFFQNVSPRPTIPRDASVSTEFTQARDQWIEYRGHNGLYFKYPPEWRADELTPNKMMLYTADLLEPPKGAPIVIYRNDEKTFDLQTEAFRSVVKEVKEQPVEYAGLTGIEFAGYITSRDLGELPFTAVVLDNNDGIIVAEYTLYGGAADYSQAFRDMLATLEVTAAQSLPAPSPKG